MQIFGYILAFIIFGGLPLSLVLVMIANLFSEPYKQKKQLLETEEKHKSDEYHSLLKDIESLKIEKQKYENAIKLLQEKHIEFDKKFKTYITQKCSLYPHLAAIMSDLLTIHYHEAEWRLLHKKRPALIEAKRINELCSETRKIIKEKKQLEYKLAYITELFPNIEDVFDEGFNEDTDFNLESNDDTDRVRLFLSHDEYIKLSTVEKNQLALDRYIQNRKSKWQIGRDYEMYIGQAFENKGFCVEYTGIIENLEDMGRDLIAKKENKTYIVQCKNWSQEKTIHEKHIFQLYGTVILKTLENPETKVRGIFVTSTSLSDKAKAIAQHLNIWVYQKISLKPFARIKCNINRTSGEKIYHLPFDQQYDKTIIEKETGEFYALTVSEAEEKGFRRAWRHYE